MPFTHMHTDMVIPTQTHILPTHTNTRKHTHTRTDDECLLFPSSGRRASRHCQRAIPGQERQGDQADDPADPRRTPEGHSG